MRSFPARLVTAAFLAAGCAGGLAEGAQSVAGDGAPPPADDAVRPVLEDALARQVAPGAVVDPAARVRVVIRLRNSPWVPLMRTEREAVERLIGPLSLEIQEAHRALRPAESQSPEQEKAWLAEVGEGKHRQPADVQARLDELAASIEQIDADTRQRVRAKVLPIVTPEHDALAARIEQLGGVVVARSIGLSGLTAELPESALAALGKDPLVLRIYEAPSGRPALDHSALALGLPTSFWANNVLGQSWDVGVVDSGCQQNHPSFGGVIFDAAPGVLATDLVPEPGGTVGHGTAVTGIITSRDATYRGVAPGLDRVLVGRANGGFHDAHSDWMVTTAADDPEAINLSWEFGTAIADDDDMEQFYDAIVDDFDCGFVVAAGNNGGTTSTITRPSVARNSICVADLDIFDTADRADDRLRATSGHGPVPVTLRKKPDIAAPGQNTWTPRAQWQSGGDFVNFNGTSGAAPHVTGGYLLVVQTRGDQTTYANKAVLINAADAWSDNGTDADYTDDDPFSGSLWNKAYGWGSMNLGSAYFNATDVIESFVSTAGSPFPTGPAERLYHGTLFNGEKATLVWNRPMFYNGTMMAPGVGATYDLDLRLYRQSDGALADTSLSTVDNVEQVGINAAEEPGDPGTPVVIKVTMDSANAFSGFALATEENFAEASGPVLSTSLSTTQNGPFQTFLLRIAVSNTGDVTAQNVITTLDAPPAGWTFFDTLSNVGAVGPGQTRYAEFLVRSPCDTDGGSALVSWVSSSSSYGRQYSDAGSSNITITVPSPLVSDVPQLIFSPASGASRSFATVANEFHVVASRPAASDWSLMIDDGDPCFSSGAALAFSDNVGLAVDLVVLNSNNAAVPDAGTIYANAALVDADLGFFNTRVEFEVGFDLGGASTNASFALEEVVEVFEKPLVGGVEYRAAVEVLSGSPELSLLVFGPLTTYGNAGSALAAVDSANPGMDVSASFTAPASGIHGFVAVKRNLGSGSILLRVTCTADFDTNGTVEVPDIFAFLSAWFANDPDAYEFGGTSGVPAIFAFLSAWFAGC